MYVLAQRLVGRVDAGTENLDIASRSCFQHFIFRGIRGGDRENLLEESKGLL